MPISWTTNDGGKLENGNTCKNKAATGAGHKPVLAVYQRWLFLATLVLHRVE